MRKVIATTSSYGIGLTGLLTEQALSITEQCAPGQFLFISGEREQFPGLFAKLRERSVRNEIIAGFDDHGHFLKLAKTFERYVDDFKPDVVLVNTNWQLVIAVLAKYLNRHRFAVIYTIHGYRHNYPVRAIGAKFLIGGMLYFFADRVIAPSSFLRQKFSFLESKMDTLFIGVDKSFLGPYVPLSTDGPKRIIFAGAFRKGKNQDVLIRVLKQYIQVTGDNEVELYLPGDGGRLPECMMLSKELGLERKVFFPGFVDREKMLEYYRMCQFAAVPSNVETFGQCVSEPFALGRIVISRRVGVAEDVIVHGKTGYLFDTEEQLLQVLLTVLPNSATWGTVSRAAYDRRHFFDWGPICSRYLEIINGRPAASKWHIAVVWQRFLPYHVARIRRLRERCAELGYRLTAIEVASQDASYGFDPALGKTNPDHVVCFSGSSYHDHRAAEIHAKVLAALNRAQPDVVFAPATPFPEGMAAVAYRRRSGRRTFMMDDAWEYTDRRGAVVTAVKRMIHANIDGVFIPSASHVAYFKKLGFPEDKIILGVDVVDNDHFSQGADQARAEAASIKIAAALPDDYFLYVGRPDPRKGLETLLAAYATYRARVGGKAWELVLVGSNNYPEMIWRAAADIEGVHLAGPRFRDELCRYYGLAKVLIVPSESDSWGLVVNEGLASGLPVIISTGCGAAGALVSEGENGWCFSPRDTGALTDLMLRASSLSPEALARMGRKSREIIGAWSLDRFVDGVLQAVQLPRSTPAGFLSDLAVRLWKGRVRYN